MLKFLWMSHSVPDGSRWAHLTGSDMPRDTWSCHQSSSTFLSLTPSRPRLLKAATTPSVRLRIRGKCQTKRFLRKDYNFWLTWAETHCIPIFSISVFHLPEIILFVLFGGVTWRMPDQGRRQHGKPWHSERWQSRGAPRKDAVDMEIVMNVFWFQSCNISHLWRTVTSAY